MKNIFINLKRFEVARSLGGLCDVDSPEKWITGLMGECIKLGLGTVADTQLSFLLPEALIIPAVNILKKFPMEETIAISIGCQGVHREDIKIGGNFGAFTTTLPATAAKAIGCEWAMIGHSEERRNMQSIMEAGLHKSKDSYADIVSDTVNQLMNKEVLCALNTGLKVLYCVGETAEEKGNGSFEEQMPQIKAVLKKQLEIGLTGAGCELNNNNVVIGYEPIWAIGPGKTPPDKEYIAYVSRLIKDTVKELYGFEIPVVYGGGLKEENAAMIASIDTIDGGLVALTRFSGQIGFYMEDLKKIIEKYIQVNEKKGG
ncbi:triose-phosphate isomerase family protein [Pelosinus fermentans]|uniref:Triosephosphate isomerase n=1 Tax=Pelosinus fermentans JBW45 TaxID=1192197 RepID=I9DEI4_9FIRM|nr:triose-phosphate isomerase family protein [Pelosinus fermentans]AJQ28597.1 Triose-phosphate isomerase [Pelosinus fermentans JBW45]